MNITPVILSGGSGSRLWPLSRTMRPKQFLAVTDEKTLFQLTLQRLHGIPGLLPPVIVSNQEHRFLVAEQCREAGVAPSAIILEPFGRNTAPAITAAALHAQHAGADPVLLVLPSDHVFANPEAFRQSVIRAAQAAEQGQLVTFGITPTHPETGYGYICIQEKPLPRASVKSLASSKNRIWPRQNSMSPQVSISGTAGCSCSERRHIWKS